MKRVVPTNTRAMCSHVPPASSQARSPDLSAEPSSSIIETEVDQRQSHRGPIAWLASCRGPVHVGDILPGPDCGLASLGGFIVAETWSIVPAAARGLGALPREPVTGTTRVAGASSKHPNSCDGLRQGSRLDIAIRRHHPLAGRRPHSTNVSSCRPLAQQQGCLRGKHR
jgi:hypothetical protein